MTTEWNQDNPHLLYFPSLDPGFMMFYNYGALFYNYVTFQIFFFYIFKLVKTSNNLHSILSTQRNIVNCRVKNILIEQ